MRAWLWGTTLATSLSGGIVGCSLLTDLDGLSGGTGDGTSKDGAIEGSTGAEGGEGGDGQACTQPPNDPMLLSDAIAITAGTSFSCALRAGGTVTCWGDNGEGQLGKKGSDSSTPYTVPGLAGIRAVTAGELFACALDSDGHVWCWGDNTLGQLGTGATTGPNTAPARVVGDGGKLLEGVTALAAGNRHVCAATGGTLVCWGSNTYGQLGRGGNALLPAAVAGITNPTDLTLGSDYTCVVGDDTSGVAPRALYCWGLNDLNQLAKGGPETPLPQRIALRIGAAGAYPIAFAGRGHACARDDASSLWCWGENDYGQLGPGLGVGPPSPILQKLTSFGAIRTVSAGDDFSCVVGSDGKVSCLGENSTGQAGNGSHDFKPDGGPSAPHVNGSPVSNLPAVDRLASGDAHTCAILAHPCAELGGPVMCWGKNVAGQLGNGTVAATDIPVRVRAP